VKGARTEDLVIKFYTDVEDAYQALKNDSIDILGYEITADLYDDAINDTNILLAPVGDLGMYELDINNNYTMYGFPGIRSPTNYVDFRRAIAFLTDRDYIIDVACGGFANRIDQPLAYVQRDWRNTSGWYEDGSYPYEYNPEAAVEILDTAGFIQGSTNNSYFDPEFPGSVEKIRTYPIGHSKAGEDLDDLTVVVRGDDLRRLLAGTLLADNMRKAGIPVDLIIPPCILCPWFDWTIYEDKNYHIYTGGWSVRNNPPKTLYGLYHSSNWTPEGGSNYVTGFDSNGDPNYPELDNLIEVASSPDNLTDSKTAFKEAMGIVLEQCITVPLFSAKSYWAYSKQVQGVVNAHGYSRESVYLFVGPENLYTFMNAYKTDGSPVRYGLRFPPLELNIIYSGWFYDHQCLDRINLYGGLSMLPYDSSVDQAGVVSEWQTATWSDNGTLKTKVSKRFRDDCYFAEPVSGNQRANVNSSHFFFSSWYLYACDTSWYGSKIKDLHHIDIVDSHEVDIYFDTLSYWNTYDAAPPFLPMDTWIQQPALVEHVTETYVEGSNLTTPGPINLTKPVLWVGSVTANDLPLVMFTDYNIVKGQLMIHHSLSPNTVVDVECLSAGDASGYTPGNLPWQTILEGAGTYYASDLNSTHLVLKGNNHFWMETPLLGEVDFVRKPDGCFKIDIFDVVMAATAYGSQGTGIPDSNWLPGADLAPPAGEVDIFDIVTITGKYGEEFDCNP